MKIYTTAREYARQRGIIIADTKFEFGMFDGKLLLIGRGVDAGFIAILAGGQHTNRAGAQAEFRQYWQFVRDYLETLDWDKTPPAPALPPEVVERTQAKYLEKQEKLTLERKRARSNKSQTAFPSKTLRFVNFVTGA